MLPYYISYLVVLIGTALCFATDARWRAALHKVFVPLLLTALCIFAGFRSARVDRDYLNYLAWFDLIGHRSLSLLDWIKDPPFVFFSSIAAKLHFGYVAVLTLFVAAALAGKVWFASKTCPGQWFTLFLYLAFCKFFLSQEMTQIRAAVAVPLVSMAILLAWRGKKAIAIATYLGAALFHISALTAFPVFLLLLFGVRFRSIYWLLSLIPIGIAIKFMIHGGWLQVAADFERLNPYLNGDVNTGVINFFSIFLLARSGALLIVVCGLWRRLTAEERLFVFCSALGLCLQIAFAANDNLALRTSELFGLFDILVLIMPLRHVQAMNAPLAAAYLIVLLAVGGALFASAVRIVQPYSVSSAIKHQSQTPSLTDGRYLT